MSISLRIVLGTCALITALVILYFIRRSHMQIGHTIFWFAFSLGLIVLAVFPQLAFYASRLLGIESPANFVYLAVIFLLIVKSFSLTVKLSHLDTRLTQLAEYVALAEHKVGAEKQQERNKPA